MSVFKCKMCNQPITHDVVKINLNNSYVYDTSDIKRENYESDEEYQFEKRYAGKSYVHAGIYALNLVYKKDVIIQINKQSLHQDLTFNLENRECVGCCDICHGDLHCTCGELLGEINVDCWQLQRIDIFKKKVFK